MRKLLKLFLMLLVIATLAFFLGPRPDRAMKIKFANEMLGSDLNRYLEDAESRFPDTREGLAKRIVWADSSQRNKTPLALVYLHGFSASSLETSPLSETVAKALGANLYLSRLAGHARTGEALANAELSQWADDTAEALSIGKQLGERTIVISTSTGATLAVWAASHPDLAAQIDGLVLISPNFAVHALPTWVMNMPWAEFILPALGGKHRSWEPANERHAYGWTTSYPSKAIFPMAALLKNVEEIDVGQIKKPALFIYSDQDTVVIAEKTAERIEKWGGQTTTLKVEDSQDRNHHVIAGDILSPNTTQHIANTIIEWASKQ